MHFRVNKDHHEIDAAKKIGQHARLAVGRKNLCVTKEKAHEVAGAAVEIRVSIAAVSVFSSHVKPPGRRLPRVVNPSTLSSYARKTAVASQSASSGGDQFGSKLSSAGRVLS